MNQTTNQTNESINQSTELDIQNLDLPEIDQPEQDSLCWYCKRNPTYGIYKDQGDYESYEHTCPWMEFTRPVKEWEATKGAKIEYTDQRGNKQTTYGMAVHKCPLYERGFKQSTYFEYLDMVQQALGCSYGIIHQKTERYLKKFEKQFNTKVPIWVWVEYYFKQWEKQQKSAKTEN